jgi:hypothetical protein
MNYNQTKRKFDLEHRRVKANLRQGIIDQSALDKLADIDAYIARINPKWRAGRYMGKIAVLLEQAQNKTI